MHKPSFAEATPDTATGMLLGYARVSKGDDA
jgi:hypothetical protein